MPARSQLVVGLVLAAVMGCAEPSKPPPARARARAREAQPQSAAPADDAPVQAPDPRARAQAAALARDAGVEAALPFRFKACVLHAGDVKSSGTKRSLPDGAVVSSSIEASCWFNAECVQEHGHDTPGDGFVELECKQFRCECVREPLTPRAAPARFAFGIDELCASADRAEGLIREHCMRGMEFAPRGLRREPSHE